VIGHRAGKWRFPREEAAERPAGHVQRAGAAGGQRVRTPRAELWPHAHANNRRRKCSIIFFSFFIRRWTDFPLSLQYLIEFIPFINLFLCYSLTTSILLCYF